MQITVLEPTAAPAQQLTKEDVWGEWTPDHTTKLRDGMVVAIGRIGRDGRTDNGLSIAELEERYSDTCPVWGDKLPWKSATIIGPEAQADDIAYWCEYVKGGGCISRCKRLPDGKIAFRCDYMAW